MMAIDNLGPSSSNQLQSSSGLENAAGGSDLQPAGSNGVGGSSSAGLTAPTGQELQGQAPTQDALKVLAGETDGEPQNPNTSLELPAWSWIIGAMLALGLAVAVGIFWRRQRTYSPEPTSPEPTSPELSPDESSEQNSNQADLPDDVVSDAENAAPGQVTEPGDTPDQADSAPVTAAHESDAISETKQQTEPEPAAKKTKRRHKHRR